MAQWWGHNSEFFAAWRRGSFEEEGEPYGAGLGSSADMMKVLKMAWILCLVLIVLLREEVLMREEGRGAGRFLNQR
jgi:hypothetical protein